MTVHSVGSGTVKGRRGRPGYDLERLLFASVEVFSAKGFDGSSMEDLSRHLGISKSAIYHHVASKDELLGLALGRALDALDEAVADTRQASGDPVDRLDKLLRASVAVLVRERQFVALLLRVRGNTAVEKAALARRRAFDTYLAGLVAEAVDAGLVRSDIAPALTARLLFGLINSLTEWVRPQKDPRAVADAICAIAFHGLLTDVRSTH